MIFLCCVAAYIDAGSITVSVPSVVAAVGGEVTLPCGIDDDHLGDSTLSWNRIVDDTPEIRIYHSKIAPTTDVDKYAVGKYSLTIKKLEINDGGYYKCSLEGTTSDVKQTAVVVVGTYTLTQYIAANIIGASTVHVVNGPTFCNVYMDYLPSLLLYCSLHTMVWELGRAFIGDRHSSAPPANLVLWGIWQDLSVEKGWKLRLCGSEQFEMSSRINFVPTPSTYSCFVFRAGENFI